MPTFRNLSINRKFTIIMMLTISASLTLASISFLINDWTMSRQLLIDDVRGSAEVVASNSQAALLFHDMKSGEETLSALSARKNIIAAAIYGNAGELFASYVRDTQQTLPNSPPFGKDGYYFYDSYMDLYTDIKIDGEIVGAVLIRSDLEYMQARFERYMGIVIIVLIVSALFGYVLTSRLRRFITEPILRLVDTARAVTIEKDFSVRAKVENKDEIGTLISGFNDMLAEIQTRDIELDHHRQKLEEQVTLRTAELSKSNKMLQREILERQQVQEVRQRYQDGLEKLDAWMRQLIAVAGRRKAFYEIVCAGISDIVNANIATLPLANEAGDEFIYAAATGKGAEDLPGTAMIMQDGEMEGWVIHHQEALSIPDASKASLPQPMIDANVSSCLMVPLMQADKVIGVLHACKCEGSFDVVDEQILSLFGQRVATALDNLRLLVSLEEEKERAEVTLHSIGDAVITTDGMGYVVFMNPIAERLTGWSRSDAKGLPVKKVFNIVNEVDGEAIENPVNRCLKDRKIVELSDNTQLVSKGGECFAISDSAAPILDRKGDIIGVVMVFQDVSKERDLKNQLSWQAAHDGLTGLVNRREFERRLDLALAKATEDDSNHALLYLDLDQFKIVNDTCGHVAGDELLRQLTTLLQENVRSTDTLARLGGDEFGLLLEGCPLGQAQQVAEGLRKSINEFRFGWDNKHFEVGVSIGLVPIHASSGAKTDVLSAADVACYAAKDLGRNRVHVYQHEDADLARRHGEIRWVSRITEALEKDRLELFRQKIVPVAGPPVEKLHYEVLIRMRDEEGKLIPPGAFIPSAERYNLMPSIDRWVIKRCFAGYEPGVAYSINLSGTSVNEAGLLDFIQEQFNVYKVPPSAICFELTETSAIANLSNASDFIRSLKEIGCMFALDDFGSGLSSFAYLKNLPVDFLKIDGQFVQGMIGDPADQGMVKSINEIGHIMGMRTIAEFVESTAILAVLHELGVDYAQGFCLHKPEPMPELPYKKIASA